MLRAMDSFTSGYSISSAKASFVRIQPRDFWHFCNDAAKVVDEAALPVYTCKQFNFGLIERFPCV
jgi:hypothetical protein